MPASGKVVQLKGGVPAWLFAIIVTGVSLGVGYALDKFSVNNYAVAIVGNNLNAYICLAGVAFAFTNLILGGFVIDKRIQYGVGHPLVYPNADDLLANKKTDSQEEKEKNRIRFICAVRGHENFHEFMSFAQYLFAAGVFASPNKELVALAALVFAVARILYGIGYATGNVAGRIPGFVLSLLPLLATQGTLGWYFIKTVVLQE